MWDTRAPEFTGEDFVENLGGFGEEEEKGRGMERKRELSSCGIKGGLSSPVRILFQPFFKAFSSPERAPHFQLMLTKEKMMKIKLNLPPRSPHQHQPPLNALRRLRCTGKISVFLILNFVLNLLREKELKI